MDFLKDFKLLFPEIDILVILLIIILSEVIKKIVKPIILKKKKYKFLTFKIKNSYLYDIFCIIIPLILGIVYSLLFDETIKNGLIVGAISSFIFTNFYKPIKRRILNWLKNEDTQ